ncbi:glucose-1-phosphate thymidylyltransferase RfbA [Pseudomaricurvus alkylphenolicus]|uniref:glucose-1-phosphate thymidylyltransferase RfbA n=1 Tax=Pseudomaricurvus alkylphenolicus TaxID=1306991 RepID=UPI00142000FC|nr:glucose-1-phosphate thymidylyltransferase RfbA [Pseudomaricurvus alkylphenolicus]NIB40025.1 glucose-1-phosphate thymidylyltransferase RfbA [Pseudomaricurvus alkylphenolicus]
MKGIVLAGGTGTRLYPTTLSVCKHLLPVYDKPMIYYPISVLMLAGIRDILIITTPEDRTTFERLLGNGQRIGVRLSYRSQEQPRGIAEAILIGDDFIGSDPACLVLGDNLFFGQGFTPVLERASRKIRENGGALVFAYPVKDPNRFGVIEFDDQYNAVSVEEKPQRPRSNYAITGLYFFDSKAVDFAKSTTPSARGELEITDILQRYLLEHQLSVELLGRGFAWLDTGTHDSLLEASTFVQIIEQRQGFKIACLEEIAFNRGWMSEEQVEIAAGTQVSSIYGDYLRSILAEHRQQSTEQ